MQRAVLMGSMGMGLMMEFQLKTSIQGTILVSRGKKIHKRVIGATLAKLFLLGTRVV